MKMRFRHPDYTRDKADRYCEELQLSCELIWQADELLEKRRPRLERVAHFASAIKQAFPDVADSFDVHNESSLGRTVLFEAADRPILVERALEIEPLLLSLLKQTSEPNAQPTT